LDIQFELIFINGMVHLPQEWNFGTPTTLFTSYTTLTLHSCFRSDFPAYVTSHVHYTCVYYVYWVR